MEEDSTPTADATLELTLLSASDVLKWGPTFLRQSKPSLLAWVDPALKVSTKTLNPSSKLHLPLSSQVLQNPNSSYLTLQILSPRLPFRSPHPLASAAVPLSSLPATGGILDLPLRRKSGRAHGCIRLAVRVLWSLGPSKPEEDAGESFPADECFVVEPTAPPLPPALAAKTLQCGAARSFLVGLASGVVAVVLVGAVGLSET
ncbi:uncharacterized protein [Typha angustifolia]|uniref:uncharacterized protein n=1 Tax=Typha angustifolia TaxID=59011 RepID=UPI003C2B7006